MPKIPVYESQVGAPGPEGIPYARMPDMQGFNAGAGWMQAAEAGTALSNVGMELEKQLTAARQANEYANLSVKGAMGLSDVFLKYKMDTDYPTLTSRFAEEGQKFITDFLGQTQDEQVKSHLTITLGKELRSHLMTVADLARKGSIDVMTADIQSRMEDRLRLAAGATGIDRDRIIAQQAGDLQGMARAGVIKFEKAQEEFQRFHQRLDNLSLSQTKVYDPVTAIRTAQDPNQFPNATPEHRQRIIDSSLKMVDVLERRKIADAERAERVQERGLKLAQEDTFNNLWRGFLDGKATLDDVDKAYRERRIDAYQARQLHDFVEKDYGKALTDVLHEYEGLFRTKGLMAELDPAAETFLAGIKQETIQRVQGGKEEPQAVRDEIFYRERNRLAVFSNIGNAADAFPGSRYLEGSKNDLAAIERAEKRVVQALQTGELNSDLARIEARKLRDLRVVITYQQEMKQRATEARERAKPKK